MILTRPAHKFSEGHFEEASGHGGSVSISGLSLSLSYLSAGLKIPNLLSVITPFTAFPTQQRECLISRVEEKVRMWQWLSAVGPEKGWFCGTLVIRSHSQEMIIVIVCVCECVSACVCICVSG